MKVYKLCLTTRRIVAGFGLSCLGLIPTFISPPLAIADPDDPRLVIDSGGHQVTPKFVAFTRDGKYLVSAGDDKTVRVWDLASGRTVRKILGQTGDGPEGFLYAGALSPDEHYLAVAGWLSAPASFGNGVVRIHDFHTGEVIELLPGYSEVVTALTFSRDGRWLATGNFDGEVKIWDTAGWKLTQTLAAHAGEAAALSFSPDGATLVSGSYDKTLKLWDRASGRLLQQMTGHAKPVLSAAFSPDGRLIASGGQDRTVKLWDGHSGTFLRDLASQGSNVDQIAFSPDGRVLLTAAAEGDSVSHVFELATGREIASQQHTDSVASVAFSADGKMVAGAGGEDSGILVWNPADGTVSQRLSGSGSDIRAVGVRSDGAAIAFGTTLNVVDQNHLGPLEKTLSLGRLSLSAAVSNPQDFLRAKEQSGDLSLRLKSGDHMATLQIVESGEVKREITRDSTSGFRHDSWSFSPDGSLIGSGGSGGTLSLYPTSGGNQPVSCVGHSSDVWSVSFSPDGRTLVSGSADQTVRLWDVSPASCRNLLTLFVSRDNEWIAWTPEGNYTSSSNGDKYIGWLVNRGLFRSSLFLQAGQFRSQFYRPDVVAAFLRTRNIGSAVREADAAKGALQTSVLGPSDVLNNMPPRIVVFEPATERLAAKEQSVRIRAAAVADLPITGFEVLVNGRCQLGCDSVAAGSAESERRIDATVELQPGDNKIDFLATHAKAASPAKEFVVTWQPSPRQSSPEKPKLIVLTIGVSAYRDPALSRAWAAKDAFDVENAFLTQKNNALYSDVKHHHIVDADVTTQRVLEELKWLNDQGGDNDVRVVFLSAAAGIDASRRYVLFPANHDAADTSKDLPWNDFVNALARRNRKSVLIVDPRRAGDVNFDEVLSETKSRFRGLFTFASVSGTETSFEEKEWQHGAFTTALLNALSDASAAGRVLSTDDLSSRVKEGLKTLKVEQHPTGAYTPGLNGFPFFVASTRKP